MNYDTDYGCDTDYEGFDFDPYPKLTNLMYSYKEQREAIFTEAGQRMFLSIRDRAKSLIAQAGAARMLEIIHGCDEGDSWQQMACVDRMVGLGELREITKPITMGQYRVFTAPFSG